MGKFIGKKAKMLIINYRLEAIKLQEKRKRFEDN